MVTAGIVATGHFDVTVMQQQKPLINAQGASAERRGKQQAQGCRMYWPPPRQVSEKAQI